MNNSPPVYDDTPIQDGRGMSNQSQDSDDSNDELNQRDLLSIQNRLFHQAASGNQQDNQQQGNTGENRNRTEKDSNDNNNNDRNNSNNSRDNPHRNQGDRNDGRGGSGHNNNNRDGNNNKDKNNANNTDNIDLEELETALDDQNSDSSDYDDAIIYRTLKKIKPYKLTETNRYLERYITTEFTQPPRPPLNENLPDFIAEGRKLQTKCRVGYVLQSSLRSTSS
jgi:hypothetical protein